jgi:hypothetical protein
MDDPGGGGMSYADFAAARDCAESDDGDDFVDYGAENGPDTGSPVKSVAPRRDVFHGRVRVRGPCPSHCSRHGHQVPFRD